MPGKTLQFENYTNDAQQIVVAAQRLAAEQKHAETTPLHLLARLLEHGHGMLELFRSAGADPKELRDLVELSLRKLPKEASEVAYLSSSMLGLLGRAQREAQREKAALIGIEHLLHALAQEIRGPTGEVLSAQGIEPGAFRPHISVLHQGKIEERRDRRAEARGDPAGPRSHDAATCVTRSCPAGDARDELSSDHACATQSRMCVVRREDKRIRRSVGGAARGCAGAGVGSRATWRHTLHRG